MKKIIAIAAIIASAQASAFWNNDKGYTSADSRFDGYGYGDAYGNASLMLALYSWLKKLNWIWLIDRFCMICKMMGG